MSTPSSERRLRVLLSNDDGPPGKDSPYIYGFARQLEELGWDVKVVVPSSQKSWIGKAYQIKDITRGRYFYPRHPDGQGEVSTTSRPVKREDGEYAEWILLDGTPASCVNIALHNIYEDQIDLVVSGPNYGRNSSAAFSLSSGTIGAALSGSLSSMRAVAVSYGTIEHPTPEYLFTPAHTLASRIIKHLVDDWGQDNAGLRRGEVDLYSVNIPMVEALRSEGSLPVAWTSIWRNGYRQLFRPHAGDDEVVNEPAGGPDASGAGVTGGETSKNSESKKSHTISPEGVDSAPELIFKFAPTMEGLIGPKIRPPIGSDAWAIENGIASVTPIRATFAEPPQSTTINDEGKEPMPFKL